MPMPMAIDLKVTPMVGGSSSGEARKCPREMSADKLPDARDLFDKMPATGDDETTNHFIIENIIFEGSARAAASTGGASAAAFDPDNTQSQDVRPPFTHSAFDQAGMDDPFMQDHVGMGSTFPLEHEFPKDYHLEEEGEVDIDRGAFVQGRAQQPSRRKQAQKQADESIHAARG
ncbi:DNA repair protein rhp54 [Hordeum vulgare]|nr:DNA repair protein rhp54 [Hordeum vulgare]